MNHFMARIEQRIERIPFSGCWIWMGATHRKGYGWLRDPSIGRSEIASRAVWRALHGFIPDGYHVLHTCDIPCCVNPNHLFLGSNADNVADKCRKGRLRLGETVVGHVLTNSTVREIKRLAASGWTGYAIAKHLGVECGTVYPVLKGRTWKHV